MIEAYISLKELAALPGLKYSTVYKAVQNGEIPCVKIGTRFNFLPSQIEEWQKQKIRESLERKPGRPPKSRDTRAEAILKEMESHRLIHRNKKGGKDV